MFCFRATISVAAIISLFSFSNITQSQAAHHGGGCGTDEKISIAEMTWLSAGFIAQVTDKILSDGLGCNTEIVPGDTVPTSTSMLAKGKPHIAPELWTSSFKEIWDKSIKEGKLIKAGDIFTDGPVEGWFVPDYVMKDNPKLKSVFDLKDHAELFVEASSNGKGRLYSCPPGWACEITTTHLFEALKLDDKFEIFSPGSGANLKASIARKVKQKKPVLSYYWGPTDVLGKFGLKKLDGGEFIQENFDCLAAKECDDPKVSDYAVSEVAIGVAASLKDLSPNSIEILSKMQFPNEIVNNMLAWGSDNSASTEEIAIQFLKNHEDVWKSWVSEEAFKKIKASL